MIASHANGSNEIKCSENKFHERTGFINMLPLKKKGSKAPEYDLCEGGRVDSDGAS